MNDSDRSRQSLPIRTAGLWLGLWALVVLLCNLFIIWFFPPPEGHGLLLEISLWAGAVLLAWCSFFLVLRFYQPLMDFYQAHSAGSRMEPAAIEAAQRAAESLYFKLASVGAVCPVALMAGVGAFIVREADLPAGHIGYYLLLGLFGSLIMGMVFFFSPEVRSGAALEAASSYGAGVRRRRGLSLRAKTIMLGFGLASMPALLVGAFSNFHANRLMAEELGRRMAGSLILVERGARNLEKAGADRSAIERYLATEARKLGEECFLHLVGLGGKAYRSPDAEPLSGDLFRAIAARREPLASGTMTDPVGTGVYAFAFGSDGSNVLIAPVRAAALKSTRSTLLGLTLGILVCALLVAGGLGWLFASYLSGMIRRMLVFTGEVARGELRRDLIVVGDDEIGELGDALHGMADNLRRMVRDVSTLANQIASTCDRLLLKASAIATGADVQAQSVLDASSAVQRLNETLRGGAASLQQLAQSARQTVEVADKVNQGFSLMQGECGSLQQTVDRTGQIVEKMGRAVQEVAQVIHDLSGGAVRSAQSMLEVDRSVAEVTTRAAETAQMTRRAIDVAQEGAVAVRRTIEGMDRIVDSTRRASSVILGLGNRIEAIGSILGVIEEIADQTNLLALNAAIIAAQAGEHGRGFAVVADEIRSLAERTASSTREIGQMINDIQEASGEAMQVMRGGGATVNEGVNLAQQAGEALNQILVNVQRAAENVEIIAKLTETQAQSSAMVTREINQVAELAGRISQAASSQSRNGESLLSTFRETMRSSETLGKLIHQQAQENRLALATVGEMRDSSERSSAALSEQTTVSDSILRVIEQVREIAKNHARAAQEMGEATQSLAEKSARLKQEIDSFHV